MIKSPVSSQKDRSDHRRRTPLRRQSQLHYFAPYLLSGVLAGVVLSGMLIFILNDNGVSYFLAGCVFILCSALGLWAAKRAHTPLSQLVDVAEELASEQDDSNPHTLSSFDPLIHEFKRMPQMRSRARHAERQLERYVGTHIAGRILAGDDRPGGKRTHASVLFADIRDFTSLMEASTDVDALFEGLNEYYALMQRVVANNGGVINKFGGDSVLALFGQPFTDGDHAFSAVCAAGEIMDELAILNQSREKQSSPPFRIGIGVNTGTMIIGNLGSEQRLEFTAMGDCVNAAKRLSDLSKETPFYSIFVGKDTLDDIANIPDDWDVDELGEIRVKGRKQPVVTYAVTPLNML